MATSAARRYRRRRHGGVDGRPETASKRQEPEERRGEAGLRFEVDGGRSGAHRRWGSKATTAATSSKRRGEEVVLHDGSQRWWRRDFSCCARQARVGKMGLDGERDVGWRGKRWGWVRER
ncbi:hypothetical protein E2562_010194 [Oryza meyeriana var. granulata]|uniref:DUF834 domain-containing protein n=1 Tax=Oryza meyeriana var. granulata TaxID=110450 RepID=A0A6G1EHK2_9ORYZ|nr:hypothetical protein E2562_010194 [Oryza meyeriana var. granulata]